MDDSCGRVSDADRERAVGVLREHLLAGRLTLDEFSERVGRSYEARTGQELLSAREHLPELAPAPTRSTRRPTRLTAALFGRVARRGRLRLRGWTVVTAAFADLDVDLREAQVDGLRIVVPVFVALGNVDVYLPEGVNVDVSGLALFGHRREWGRDLDTSDAPTVHLRVFGCFATIDIWRVPHDMHGSYGKIVKQIRKQQRQLPV